MSDHMQQQVMDAVATALVSATDAGARVYVDRVDPLPASLLPAVLVEESDAGEDVQVGTIHGAMSRFLEVVVRCCMARTESTAAEVRAFGLAAEKAIAGNAAIAALCSLGFQMTGSRMQQTGEADLLYAERVQTWRFGYMTTPGAPETAL